MKKGAKGFSEKFYVQIHRFESLFFTFCEIHPKGYGVGYFSPRCMNISNKCGSSLGLEIYMHFHQLVEFGLIRDEIIGLSVFLWLSLRDSNIIAICLKRQNKKQKLFHLIVTVKWTIWELAPPFLYRQLNMIISM